MRKIWLTAAAVILGAQWASASPSALQDLIEASPVPAPAGLTWQSLDSVASIPAAQRASAAAGAALQCRKVRCYDVEKPVNAPTWCDEGSWKTAAISVQGSGITLSADGRSASGRLSEKDGIVTGDFSEGDQTATLTGTKTDLTALLRKTKAEIPVVFADGFDWADGSHIRYKIDFLCRL